MSYQLAKKSVTIVSGLALGIDAIAHTAALDAGGNTIAVLASGASQITPRSNTSLANRLLDSGGAIISETDHTESMMAWQFLQRNRIVSGLGDALIIIEAAARSGTLSTAAHALEQGRPVFALPGNITNPLSAGCNKLIQQGAIPLLSVDDVLLEIGLTDKQANGQISLPLGDTPLETDIIKQLAAGIRDGDELMTITKAPASEFAGALTMLELNGVVRPLGANQWTLR